MRISELIHLSGENFSFSEEKLTRVVKWLNEIREDVSGFRRLVRHLEVQAVSVKIESARAGNDLGGFANLADSINNLAGIIAGKSGAFKTKSLELQKTIENAKIQINNLLEYHNKNNGLIENKTRNAIKVLIEKYRSSSDKAEKISGEIDLIHKEVSSLVTAIQFHDITRQQLQNVIEIIAELLDNINAYNAGNSSEKELPALMHYVNHVSKLQAAQLVNSKNELEAAVKEINRGLTGISGEISSISEAITDLVKDQGNGSESFFERTTEELSDSIRLFTRNSEAGKEFSYSIKNVADTIDTLSHFISEIDDIGAEIELISLNANIKAAKTGTEGAALGVLAKAIQRLSGDSKKQTESVIEKLISVKNVSDTLHNSNNDETISRSQQNLEDVTSELNSRISFQDAIVNDAIEQLNEVEKSISNLKEDLSGTIGMFDSYINATGRIGEAAEMLEEIAHLTEQNSGQIISDINLLELSNKYTMKIQREIHQKIFSDTEFEEKENNTDEQGSEFGDNIELF